MNSKNLDFLAGKPPAPPKPEQPPAKKYTDNAAYDDHDSPLFKGDPHKTDMAD